MNYNIVNSIAHFFSPFSGVILDMEFTQKLQNIMGKGSQTSSVNTPTGVATKTIHPSESEQELTPPPLHGIQQTSGGNSRFSISPVSDSKPTNASVIGGNKYNSLF